MTSTIETTARFEINVGDKLRAIAEDGMGHSLLEYGEIVTVEQVDEDDWDYTGNYRMVYARKANGEKYTAYAYRFEPYTDLSGLDKYSDTFDWQAHGTNRLHLRVGDKALATGQSARTTKGKVVTITGLYWHYATVEAEDGTRSDVWFGDLFEVPQPEADTRYQPGDRVRVVGYSDYWDGPATVDSDTDLSHWRVICVTPDGQDFSGGFDPMFIQPLTGTDDEEPLAEWERELLAGAIDPNKPEVKVGDRVLVTFAAFLIEAGSEPQPGTVLDTTSQQGRLRVHLDKPWNGAECGSYEIYADAWQLLDEEPELTREDLRAGDRVVSIANPNDGITGLVTIRNTLTPGGFIKVEGKPGNFDLLTFEELDLATLHEVDKDEINVGDRVVYVGNDKGEFFEPGAIGAIGTVVEDNEYAQANTTSVEWDVPSYDTSYNVFTVNLAAYDPQVLDEEPEAIPTIDSLDGLAAVAKDGTVLRSTTTGAVYVRVEGRWKQVGSTGDASYTVAATISTGKVYEVLFIG